MTRFTDEQKTALTAPLNSAHVKQVQGNDYIEGWHAINEANRIFGFDGWSYSVERLDCTSNHTNQNDTIVVGYIAVVRVRVGDVERMDTGFGTGMSKNDPSKCHENASKEAVTDALKRCLRTFGNAFGLALYDKEKVNVSNAPDPAILFGKMKDALKGCVSVGDVKSCWADIWRDRELITADMLTEITKIKDEKKAEFLEPAT